MSGSDEAQKPGRALLLGRGIAHSLSPAFYREAFEREEMDWSYELFECATEGEARDFLAAREFSALNVTTPYKGLALECADLRAASARLADGANLLINLDGKLIAFNTDGKGCVRALEAAGATLVGAAVVVCGTGPTALAILHACAEAGATSVTLLSRDKERAKARLVAYLERFEELAYRDFDLGGLVGGASGNAATSGDATAEGGASSGASGDATAAGGTSSGAPGAAAGPSAERSLRETYEQTRFLFCDYAGASETIAAADILIDATTLGMTPGDPAPFDCALLHEGQLVMDCVYGKGETALVAGARAAGAQAFDGSAMLTAQAEISLEIMRDLCG